MRPPRPSTAGLSAATAPPHPDSCRHPPFSGDGGNSPPPLRSPRVSAYNRPRLAAPARRARVQLRPRRRDLDRSPQTLGRVRREAGLRGPAHVRRDALHGGSGRARGRRHRDRRRADGRPRLRPAGHGHGAARDPRGEQPAGAAPRGRGRRLRAPARGRLRRRRRAAGRRPPLPRRDRGARHRGRGRRCDAGGARRRPLDLRSRASAPARRPPGRSGWCTSTRTPTPPRRSSA